MRRANRFVLVFLAFASGLALACSTAPTGAPAVSQTGDWQTDWNRTLEAARREGVIRVISGSSSTNNIPSFEKAFSELVGGQVEFTELRAPDIIARLPEEYAARQYNWDIILLGGSSGISERLDAAGVLGNLNQAFIFPDLNKNETWVGGFNDIWVDNDTRMYKVHHQAELSQGSQWWVNRDVLPETRFNKVEDVFAIPELRGKFCTFDPRVEGASDANFGQIAAMYGPDLLRRLYRDVDMVVIRDYGKLTLDTLHGACLISVGARMQDLHAEGVGLHIQPFYVFRPGIASEYAGKVVPTCCAEGKQAQSGLEGWVGGGSAYTMLSIAANPPNPNAARVFVNWLLSRDGQMAWPNSDRETSCSRRVDLQQWCNEVWKLGARGKDFIPLRATGSYASIHTRSNFFVRIAAQDIATEVFGR